MKVTNCVRQEDGTHLFGVEASEEEVRILINIALEALVSVGEILEEEFEQPSFEVDLANFPIERMFKG